ncbi:MAG TPA: response regulator [Acidimicrobiales bacterium]|nr:response regulator [Acidimicrobiales bacterium]
MRVLIVDDSADMRLMVRAAVERAGHQVIDEAADGREGVGLAAALEPDAVVLDGMMPEMTGLEALPGLRRLLPGARIVMFSSIEDAHTAALEVGADAYITKGDGLAVLVAALEGESPE